MAAALTITICIIALAVMLFVRKDMVAFGHAVGRGILEFKAWLKEIDDDLWRR